MPSFRYEALNAEGRLVTGGLEAESVQQAFDQLQARGLTVQSIGFVASAGPTPLDNQPTPSHTAVPEMTTAPPRSAGESVEQAVLRSHMTTILDRGRAIMPALRAFAEEMPSGWQRRQLNAVCRVLERGDPAEATAALAELPECWIPLLSAANSSPDPGRVLSEFLTESRRTDDLRQKWWLTLAYPLILIVLVTVVMTALSILVIPQFREIFDEFDLSLPGLTKWMLWVADILSKFGLVLIVLLLALFALLLLNANRLLPSTAFAWLGDRIRPPFGRRTAIARFARFTADLLEAGVGPPDALRIAGFTSDQSRMRQAAWRMANDMESNRGIAQGAYDRPLTASIAYALTSNLRPASRVRLLREISSAHGERVRIGLSWASGIVEPVAICLVGVAVGLTVLGLFLPLVKLVEGLSK
jgi:type II secretory pathway component PulF